MRCACGSKATVFPKYTRLTYCGRCFSKLLEKRVKREIRKRGTFSREDIITVEDDGSAVGQACLHLLRQILKDVGCRITEGDNGKIFIPAWPADSEAAFLISKMAGISCNRPKGIHLMTQILISDCEAYCKIHRIKYHNKRNSCGETGSLLSHISNEYPQTIFSIVRSKTKLENWYAQNTY